MTYGSQDGVETSPLHQIYARRNWFQRNFNPLMGGLIIVLLACIGVSTYNNNHAAHARHGLSLRRPGFRYFPDVEEPKTGYLNIGMPCEDSEECRPCANETERVHCSARKLYEPRICWCKAKRLDLGETCFTSGECNPKHCKTEGKITVCSGHPQTCKCRPHAQGKKHECLHDDNCPKCSNANETSRCGGTPTVCYPCGTKYLNVGEECSSTEQCLYCANKNDKPECRSDKEGQPKICECKEHRLIVGQQCLAHEECKCKLKSDVAECSGHPRICKCAPRAVKNVGDKCRQEEECKACADPDDKPACLASEHGETRICRCKIHRLYLGEKCYGSEECKPKDCVRQGLRVECGGNPKACRCKGGRREEIKIPEVTENTFQEMLRRLFGSR